MIHDKRSQIIKLSKEPTDVLNENRNNVRKAKMKRKEKRDKDRSRREGDPEG